MKISSILKKKIKKSLIKSKIKINQKIIIQKNKNDKNGHYQLNNLYSISNINKIDPKIVSQKIIKNINSKYMIKKINFSKPCFVNIFLSSLWIETTIKKFFFNKIKKNFKYCTKKRKNVVIDYSSPNMAKSMHVGHLRSTIIGDSTARIMEFYGHNVIRCNHIGDWGTQFGMIIAYLKIIKKEKLSNIKKLSIERIEKIYCQAKKISLKNKKFLKKTEKYTAKLQQNDKYCYKIWKKIIKLNIKENKKIYKLLNITLKNKHIIGESFYKKMLPNIMKDLIKKKIAVEKDQKIIVLLKNIKNRQGKSMGVILKKNGSFLYSAIDIACMKYRYQILKANIILYYVDSRQKQHLKQVYKISKIAGYISKKVKIKHNIFGIMLNKQNKPFQTRSGNTIKLSNLIQESIIRAKKIILKKNNQIKKKKLLQLSKTIGIGALKYFDLSKNRITNYVFNWKNILSFEGNTSLYIQYTYTRIMSILKKDHKNLIKLNNSFKIYNNSETLLCIKILQFKEILSQSVKKGEPHLICNYIYELSSQYSSFYEKYNILNTKNKKKCITRLKISYIISKILKIGLKILGIKVTKSM
ncbi:arginine--tRNA ligase [Buchnera aphidicola]|uniref:arginine--tRNA ligase n=1 Tax=Buchnera aphidicola TaxID=9 RepID=UPI002238AB53|nr:arginine--tRNA ligase [Buchnera aphidicola]MCW5197665.1 arginine--tRNA ligase [Buchnera aphidicola (Chaitophorus viminalis)]